MINYRSFKIIYDPPPIPDRRFDYDIHNADLDETEQLTRCDSVDAAKLEIDEYYAEKECTR